MEPRNRKIAPCEKIETSPQADRASAEIDTYSKSYESPDLQNAKDDNDKNSQSKLGDSNWLFSLYESFFVEFKSDNIDHAVNCGKLPFFLDSYNLLQETITGKIDSTFLRVYILHSLSTYSLIESWIISVTFTCYQGKRSA